MGVARPDLDPAWRKKMIAGLLAGQRTDGGFGVHLYSKWKGAHWRLVSLVELGIPRTNRAARAAASRVLDWIAAPSRPRVIAGRERRHASMEGNALAVCCRLGMTGESRVESLVDVLLRSQWPDGGWNCDPNPKARRSSLHESLAPIWGLVECHRATGDARAQGAAGRAGELLLEHRLFRHYFHGLRALAMLGMETDSRAEDAIEVLLKKRRPDGSWRAGGHRYWRRGTEAVDWADAHEIVTVAAHAMLQ